jgi:DNA-binding SARP family transcriptional activator
MKLLRTLRSVAVEVCMMEFRVLGPLEVSTQQGPVPISGRHFPKMLAVLLNEANRIVSVDRLVDALWEHDPPATAARQVQNKAAALRHRLGAAGARLMRLGTGYRFQAEVDELDLLRCERNATAARKLRAEGRPAEAEEALAEELGTDPGKPLRDLHTAILRSRSHSPRTSTITDGVLEPQASTEVAKSPPRVDTLWR